MATDHWERIEHIFGEVCDLPVDARNAKLDELCKEDLDMRQEVERLLVHHDSDNHLLDEVALNEVAAVVYQRDLGEKLEKTPEKVGDYRIVEKIDEGGMSIVYRAKPENEDVDRDIAIKVLKLGASREEFLQRFHYEHLSLANMKHPYIAHVYEAGALEDGRPYFAMEFINGEPITEFCERKRLGLKARLDLFLSVCDGVLHAHRRGVLHRDLKPSNILVTEESGRPLPKLIDFGIAKAISDPSHRHTLVGMMMGTPAYMSPEQASNSSQVDTAIDVYGLGIVLYELMAGSLPLPNEKYKVANQLEIVKMLQDNEWPRPSVRLTDNARRASIARSCGFDHEDQLVSALEPELDWIVLRAIAKDRTERYNSIAELVADIRNYLEQRPIMARKPTLGYQMRKFIARHRMPVAFTAAIVLLVVFSITGLSYLLVENQKARAQAERGFEDVESILSSLDPRYNEPQALRDLLLEFSEMQEARPEDITRAKLHYRLAELMHSHGMIDIAEREFGKVIKIMSDIDQDSLMFKQSSFRFIVAQNTSLLEQIQKLNAIREQLGENSDDLYLSVLIDLELSYRYLATDHIQFGVESAEKAWDTVVERFSDRDDLKLYAADIVIHSYKESFKYERGVEFLHSILKLDEAKEYTVYHLGLVRALASLERYQGHWAAAGQATDLGIQIYQQGYQTDLRDFAELIVGKAVISLETNGDVISYINDHYSIVANGYGDDQAWTLYLLSILARAYLYQGDDLKAWEIYQDIESRRPCTNYLDLLTLQTLPEILLAKDDLDNALISAVDAYQRIAFGPRPHPYEVARSQWLVGLALLHKGDYASASVWLEDAWDEFVASDHGWSDQVAGDLKRCYSLLGVRLATN